MSVRPFRGAALFVAPLALAAALVTTACAPVVAQYSSTAPASANDCTPAKLKTHTPNVLTFGVEHPTIEPWFNDQNPSNGLGYEAAVAKAVAGWLHYDSGHIKWVEQGFDAAIAPGPKTFDLDINEFSITAARSKVVDFSESYYDDVQAVVALKDSPVIGLRSVSGLTGLKLGVQVGTTSLLAVQDVIKPTTKPEVFTQHDDVVAALRNKTIQAMVTDEATAVNVASFQGVAAQVVGQLPPLPHDEGVAQFGPSGKEQFGMLMEKGSQLKPCVDQAVIALKNNGSLGQMQATWLEASTDAVPTLQ